MVLSRTVMVATGLLTLVEPVPVLLPVVVPPPVPVFPPVSVSPAVLPVAPPVVVPPVVPPVVVPPVVVPVFPPSSVGFCTVDDASSMTEKLMVIPLPAVPVPFLPDHGVADSVCC